MDYGNAQTAMSGTSSVLGAKLATAEPQSPMQSVVQGLAERVQRLDSVVGDAHRRFNSVIRPEPPTTQPDKSGPRPVRASSDLASGIDGINTQLEVITDRLASLVNRCEL